MYPEAENTWYNAVSGGDMLKKNDIADIFIDDLTVEGAGVGRYDGLAVFVPQALPGEKIRVKIIKLTKSYAVGRLDDIISRSEDRIRPFCGVFDVCGGCTLQHLKYERQLEYKARYIKECFKRIGGIEIEIPVVEAAENRREYRNKASFPVALADGRVQAGFYAPHSHRLVSADCPIQKKAVNGVKNAVLKWANENHIAPYDEKTHTGLLRHIVARQSSNGDIMAGLVLKDWADIKSLAQALEPEVKSIVVNKNDKKQNAIFGEQLRTVAGNGYITEAYDGLRFRVGLKSFLQVNHEQSERLYHIALEFARLSADDLVFDLFCGIGTISLLAARQAKAVVGIEYVEEAVKDAEENARINGIGNAFFLAGDAGKMIDEGIARYGSPDIVILDPPRKGCDTALIKKIVAVEPKRVVYVSCNPSTLARDAALFAGYKVDRVIGVDMFPHTTHVETVVLMSRVID